MALSQAPDESRVLIIYTGGTIGMLVGQQGYVPEPYFLTETLRSQSRFHDPNQESLFSHSSSVQGFRDWNNISDRNSPIIASPPATQISLGSPSLLVRSSRPIGRIESRMEGISSRGPTCVQVSDNVYEAHLPSLVTPKSTVSGGTASKRIRYAILEWNPLLDSSNIETDGPHVLFLVFSRISNSPIDWIRIATEIELNYNFDAFVVLHGTDTMSYTSSALSFLLEDLGKTVILTGAQIPLSQLRNDAVDNLMGALSIAGHYIIPGQSEDLAVRFYLIFDKESCLYFNHTLFRGNRVSKMSSYDLAAFNSPNFPPLVNGKVINFDKYYLPKESLVGIDIVVNWNDVIRQTSLKRFKAHKEMSSNVVTLRLFPGIAAATIQAFLMPSVKGVVLETFGAGNAPQRTDLITALREACDRGVVIVAITQCAKGSVSDAYETGRTLMQAGIVPGGDMTPECALTKLSYLLSKPELSCTQVCKLVGVPLRGEISRPPATTPSPPDIATATDASENNLQNIHKLLMKFVSLAAQPKANPEIVLTRDGALENATAPWSWTAAEAASSEAALLPFLIHLAVARDDVESLKFCLRSEAGNDVLKTPWMVSQMAVNVAGGLVNCLEPGSHRSPLHVAALNGSTSCVNFLLESGALVHLRDSLGHTALYYAARQGHADAVDILTRAGATISEFEGEFVRIAINAATLSDNKTALEIWAKTEVGT